MRQQKEEWKEIPNFKRYEVSTLGRVRSNVGKTQKILKTTNDRGYQTITLMTGDKRSSTNQPKKIQVHRLMAMTFLPNPDNKEEVDHIIPIQNGGKTIITNLRWATKLENARNPVSLMNNRRAHEHTKKMVYQYDENLNLLAAYPSTLDAAKVLKKSQGNIVSCCNGTMHSYCGSIFSYVPIFSQEERDELENSDEVQEKKRKIKESVAKANKKYYDTYLCKKAREEKKTQSPLVIN